MDAVNWGNTGGKDIPNPPARAVLFAQHTYTTACDGLHEPGPCPSWTPIQELTWLARQ
jgi:hypothetical protein